MGAVAFDVETTSKYPYNGGRVFAYSTATEKGCTDVVRLDRTATQRHYGIKKLRALWRNGNVAKVMHNALFDITATIESGYPVQDYAPIHDTMIMSHLLRNLAPSHALDDLCWEFGGYPRDLDKAVQEAARGLDGYHQIPEPLFNKYQRADAERCMLLYHLFWPEIIRDPATLADYYNEMKLIWVTRRLIKRGYRLKFDAVEKMLAWLGREVGLTHAAINTAVGRPINPRSPKDLGQVLFDMLGLPVVKLTANGNPSTDKDAFAIWEQTCDNPILDLFLKYRSYAGAISKIHGYLSHADKYGILHTNLKTDEADTGREASAAPNLQNVDKEGDLSKKYPVPMRRLFGPRPGYVYIYIDYSGIEALLLIHYSQDKEMLKLVKAGGDPHGEAARMAYGPVFAKVSASIKKSLRNAAKSHVSFAIPYGSNKNTAERELAKHVPAGFAYKPKLDGYIMRFKAYCNLCGTTSANARRDGYITTAFGRKLWIPRNELYKSVNYLIQGTAAGVIKRAQVKVDPFLKSETNDRAGIVLPIHDEIVIEWPRDLLPKAKPILKEVGRLMCDFGDTFSVPLSVDYEVATHNWSDKKGLRI